ncbi:Acyl-CoA dehydrogenase [Desulfocicer vacuolatum DSM 3385]|uniref:Acyl-CoA dehydrogenase n=1 Tax=Desulfocicer vacuolatum DSM 3385 TaxID=1121400 RepID=A0A1W2CW61_9BACT|nr:acyl-CoA dehydrogenase family protein [Desulfocicer vacuolatum]SMC89473.1 Acyl-CoA dehydrogenase [Desulfocicer vacuolatum DSM 3385]
MFELTKYQKGIQKAALEFVKGELDKDLSFEMEKEGKFPEKILRKAAELGFLGVHFDETYLGGGMGQVENCLISETFCRKDATMGKALTLAGYASECLLRFGNDTLKESYLPRLLDGDIFSAGCFSEPGIGLNFLSQNTISIRKEGRWVINGIKNNVMNGMNACFYIVLCRDGSEKTSRDAFNMILVDAESDGVSLTDSGRKIGNNMISTAQVSFNDVAVSEDCLLGKPGKGLEQLRLFFIESHIASAAQAVGIAQGAFDRALDHVKQREQFGKKLAQFQATRNKLADMATRITMSRLMTYTAAAKFDKGDKKLGHIAAMAKLNACETAIAVSDEAIQLFGGYGYMGESEVERFYRDAKATALFEIPESYQKEIIASETIGKIRAN